jgi:SHAQKYF class myb-like DNA-binding protein
MDSIQVDSLKRRRIEEGEEDKVSQRMAIVSARSNTTSNEIQTEQWSQQQHRDFIEAIYEAGLRNASPSVIMEEMTLSHAAITSERVKSHLQKYRNNKDKSKEQFLAEYDNFLQKALTVGVASGLNNNERLTPNALLQMLGHENAIGGDLPALLTYAALHDDGLTTPSLSNPPPTSFPLQLMPTCPPDLSIESIKHGSQEFTNFFSKQDGTKIPFPVLSEDERKSPLGVSIGHVMALFCSVTQQLVAERSSKEEPVTDI